jgi:hypothetical protein
VAAVLVISPSRVATLAGLGLAVPVLLRQLQAARGGSNPAASPRSS